MIEAQLPDNEEARLQDRHRTGLLGAPQEANLTILLNLLPAYERAENLLIAAKENHKSTPGHQ